MHSCPHIPVADGARNIEEADAFHEEGSLLIIENRKPLVCLNLERITLYLTEVRIDRSIERQRACNSVFCAETHIAFTRCIVPAVQVITCLADVVCHAGDHLEQTGLTQVM